MNVERSGQRLIQVRVPYQILADGGLKITTNLVSTTNYGD